MHELIPLRVDIKNAIESALQVQIEQLEKDLFGIADDQKFTYVKNVLNRLKKLQSVIDSFESNVTVYIHLINDAASILYPEITTMMPKEIIEEMRKNLIPAEPVGDKSE